ncbi:MerR family transcriptional regulator [Bordetella sp. 15P40C-2]|uniref:MerR family transcriptional regulator n=1 Tax=Bordetella sp. 15P40C-2 TaxID=2572246 RepID=UPI00132763E9|nr:MerR family transcriptional regulator [Bordetella sp. 15P40C-2]MVW70735.1 MerR family transcriptional regulator [Bordetella sp. 15P40C-2]
MSTDAQIGGSLGASVQGPIHLAGIGAALPHRIAARGRESLDMEIVHQGASLEQTGLPSPGARIDVLVIEQSELHESAVPSILEARHACAGASLLVLYRYCASATIRRLRSQGCLVARIPADNSELISLCRSALSGERLPDEPAVEVPDLKFDEAALMAIMAAGSGLKCECPRHLADLLMMVGSFERYSAQCASRNEDDALLHKSLEHAAGQARAILERAMERLVRAEGLPS